MTGQKKHTVIVAGCPRSGTTLMMQVLHRGGVPCFGTWPAFEDYEFGNIDWREAGGKAVKLIDAHLQKPPEGEYFVVHMLRDPGEQAKSIAKFAGHMGILSNGGDVKNLKTKLKEDLRKVDSWARSQKKCVRVRFEDLLSKPRKIILEIEDKFGIKLRMGAENCVAKRGPECFDGMMEVMFNTSAYKNISFVTYRTGRCIVAVSVDDEKWHMSISALGKAPSYEEIMESLNRYIPEGVKMALDFPPVSFPSKPDLTCVHLFEANRIF